MDGTSVSGGTPPSSVDIGRAFVRQYYTMLSERPEEAFRYYGNESILSHDGGNALGPEEIQKAIDDIEFHDSKFRIFSIMGSPTLSDGIVLQVIGEITLHNGPKRKFAQTFVLGQQQAKKFYVQNDIFMYHDKLFERDEPQSMSVEQNQMKLNGHEVLPTKETFSEPEMTKAYEESASYVKIRASEPLEIKEDEKPKIEKPEEITAPQLPKTWATLVGSNTSKGESHQVSPTKPQVNSAPVIKDNTVHSSVKPAMIQDVGNKKIFVSNIIRKTNPGDTNVPAEELKKFFSSFGEVENVHIPNKVLDMVDGKAAYAFLTMRHSRDARKIIDSASEDERGYKCLKIAVPSFGFDDYLNVSEQKEQQPRYSFERNGSHPTGYQRRGGYQSGRGTGSFGARGGGGYRGGRGGPRGAHQAHS